jgi:hypothetical protein
MTARNPMRYPGTSGCPERHDHRHHVGDGNRPLSTAAIDRQRIRHAAPRVTGRGYDLQFSPAEYNDFAVFQPPSSMIGASASGARGQGFESSRAYHFSFPHIICCNRCASSSDSIVQTRCERRAFGHAKHQDASMVTSRCEDNADAR